MKMNKEKKGPTNRSPKHMLIDERITNNFPLKE